jgi:hypothetical protein
MKALSILSLLVWFQDAQDLHSKIVPQKDELGWTQIPWMSDLWAARKAASEKAKPIFLWEMDGHPLGCV